eukprot:6214790-Pleurochrysis_carterae.AAC.3
MSRCVHSGCDDDEFTNHIFHHTGALVSHLPGTPLLLRDRNLPSGAAPALLRVFATPARGYKTVGARRLCFGLLSARFGHAVPSRFTCFF